MKKQFLSVYVFVFAVFCGVLLTACGGKKGSPATIPPIDPIEPPPVIELRTVPVPVLSEDYFFEDGTIKYVSLNVTTEECYISGSLQAAAAANYTISLTLKDPLTMKWADGTRLTKTLRWQIVKIDAMYRYSIAGGFCTILGLTTAYDHSAPNAEPITVNIPTHINTYPVREIAENAFKGQNIDKLTLPEEVLTTICAGAFSNCKSLMKAVIPMSVTVVGANAFQGSFGGDIYLFPKAAAMGKNWDKDWNYYTTDPETSARLYHVSSFVNAFVNDGTHGYPDWQKMVIHPVEVYKYEIVGANVTIKGLNPEFDRSYVGAPAAEMGIPERFLNRPVTAIAEGAFEGQNIRLVQFPNSLVTIGARAFKDCKSLERIVIPVSVKNIGEFAFWGAASNFGLYAEIKQSNRPAGWNTNFNAYRQDNLNGLITYARYDIIWGSL